MLAQLQKGRAPTRRLVRRYSLRCNVFVRKNMGMYMHIQTYAHVCTHHYLRAYVSIFVCVHAYEYASAQLHADVQHMCRRADKMHIETQLCLRACLQYAYSSMQLGGVCVCVFVNMLVVCGT